MWEWFTANGVWLIIALALGLALFFLLRRWALKAIEKIIPKEWQKQLKSAQRIATWVILTLGVVVTALVVTTVIIPSYGVDINPALEAVGGWFLEHGVLILVIILLAYMTYKMAKVVMPKLVARLVTSRGKGRRVKDVQKRSHTLSRFLISMIGVVVVIVAIFMILSEIGLDITPLLAGAGVVGIAVGFGAQSIIKDFLTGLFIVLDDYYSKGDVVRVAGIAGLVEEVNLRRTILRDLDGIVHIIPNGEISVASNFTRNWSRVNINIPVAYGEDLDKVIAVINRVGQELAEDEAFAPLIIKAPQVLRVDKFGDSAIEIKVLGETQPIKQWDVMGELRKRIKKAFDEEGIEIPWPHVKLYFGDSSLNTGVTCPSCSKANMPGSKFCSHCGASLSS
ncbi:MAG: mechanosensitive ion channel [Dehalococcoidia bacterium]|nr:MAG: mechanosensitive ion channel [Dehalococcoidia bacterium]